MTKEKLVISKRVSNKLIRDDSEIEVLTTQDTSDNRMVKYIEYMWLFFKDRANYFISIAHDKDSVKVSNIPGTAGIFAATGSVASMAAVAGDSVPGTDMGT